MGILPEGRNALQHKLTQFAPAKTSILRSHLHPLGITAYGMRKGLTGQRRRVVLFTQMRRHQVLQTLVIQLCQQRRRLRVAEMTQWTAYP